MSTDTAALLRRAREVQARGFCQHYAAITETGRPCSPASPWAAAFCIVGAVAAIDGIDLDSDAVQAVWDRLDGEAGKPVQHWADAPGRTLAEVLALFDAAIAAEAAREGDND